MKYVLLENFIPCGAYEETPGSDEHGNFIMFAVDAANAITAGSFVKTPDGDMFLLKKQDYIKDSDICNNRHLFRIFNFFIIHELGYIPSIRFFY